MFHRNVFSRGVELGELSRGEVQYIRGEPPDAGARFHRQKGLRRSKQLPHFRKLPGNQSSENGVDVHARVVISAAARSEARIIAVFGMVEAFPHKFGEGDGAACTDAGGEYCCQRCFGRHSSCRWGLHVNISMMKSCKQS